MAKCVKNLKKLSRSSAKIFKIKNRRGYAVMCMNNLTEGASVAVAEARMNKVLKRSGLTLG